MGDLPLWQCMVTTRLSTAWRVYEINSVSQTTETLQVVDAKPERHPISRSHASLVPGARPQKMPATERRSQRRHHELRRWRATSVLGHPDRGLRGRRAHDRVCNIWNTWNIRHVEKTASSRPKRSLVKPENATATQSVSILFRRHGKHSFT